jgi:hypothetical protein
VSLLLLLRTADAGAPVFPPLPPSYPVVALPAGAGGARLATSAPLRAVAAPSLRPPSKAPVRRKDLI